MREYVLERRAGRSPLTDKAAEVLERTVAERSGARPRARQKGALRVVLDVAPGVGADGFRVEDAGAGAVAVVGNDERGLLYGVGKLLRDARLGPGEFTPGPWRGTSVPKRPVRGMYFATHFGNFYHAAPIELVERYVEELALWGCNTLSVWFDMHHYRGTADPAAQRMLERLRRILKAANAVGMDGALTTLANEGYADSPPELRADWTAGHDGYTHAPGGHYHCEVCPSKPAGLDWILQSRAEMLDAFADLDIRYVWLWPYDQGGCTCAACAPWGANGFLRASRAVSDLVRARWPAAKTVLSTWLFDHFIAGEWEGLERAFAGGAPEWVDYLMADDYGHLPAYVLEHGAPGGLPLVSFPEISMQGNWPWGAYGSIPWPAHWQDYERQAGRLLSGSFPYSEGLHEDLNKVMMLQLNWEPARPTADIVREYAAYEFAPEAVEDVLRMIAVLERTRGQTFAAGMRERVLDEQVRTPADLMGKQLYAVPQHGDPPGAFDLAQRVDAGLPERARKAWRWRLMWLRAAIDLEVLHSGGTATKVTDRYFQELADIYHAEDPDIRVAPPTCSALFRIIKSGADLAPG